MGLDGDKELGGSAEGNEGKAGFDAGNSHSHPVEKFTSGDASTLEVPKKEGPNSIPPDKKPSTADRGNENAPLAGEEPQPREDPSPHELDEQNGERTVRVEVERQDLPEKWGSPPDKHHKPRVKNEKYMAGFERRRGPKHSPHPEPKPVYYAHPLDSPDGTRVPLWNGPPTPEQVKGTGVVETVLREWVRHNPEQIQENTSETPDGKYSVLRSETVRTGDMRVREFEPTGRHIQVIVPPELPVLAGENHSAFADTEGAAWGPVNAAAFGGMDQAWSAEQQQSYAESSLFRSLYGYERIYSGVEDNHIFGVDSEGPNHAADLLAQAYGRTTESTYVVPEGGGLTQWFYNRGITEYPATRDDIDKQLLVEIGKELEQNNPVLASTYSWMKPWDRQVKMPNGLAGGHTYGVVDIGRHNELILDSSCCALKPIPIEAFTNNMKQLVTLKK